MADRKKVLLMATVDSSGGAGITADCITVYDNGAFPMPCAVALAPESLSRVGNVSCVSLQSIKESLDLAVSDFDAISAVKVGLIPRQDVLDLFLQFLKDRLPEVPVVWDPVLTATAGPLDSADLKKSLRAILPQVTVFTPNLPEALTLAGWDERRLTKEGTQALGRVFLEMGAKCVIIKGGHVSKAALASDTFVSRDLCFVMQKEKTAGDGAHGGGCAFSSAIAALLAQGYALQDAAVIAKAYVTQGIAEPAFSVPEGKGAERPPIGHHGLPQDLRYFPHIIEEGFPEEAPVPESEVTAVSEGVPGFAPYPLHLGLYPVLDDVDMLQRLLSLGVRTAQLRIKDKNDPELFAKIQRAVFAGRTYHAQVFIDDYYDLAIKAGAYGVHLGMEDLRTANLQAIADAGLRLGVSTHGMYEMLKAVQLNPSYIALGHIFPTQSKKMPSKPQGTERLTHEVHLLNNNVPSVAIGGIKLHNLQGVLDSKVGSVALITGITNTPDPAITTQKWLALCAGAGI